MTILLPRFGEDVRRPFQTGVPASRQRPQHASIQRFPPLGELFPLLGERFPLLGGSFPRRKLGWSHLSGTSPPSPRGISPRKSGARPRANSSPSRCRPGRRVTF